jgi:hypothetical protein
LRRFASNLSMMSRSTDKKRSNNMHFGRTAPHLNRQNKASQGVQNPVKPGPAEDPEGLSNYYDR